MENTKVENKKPSVIEKLKKRIFTKTEIMRYKSNNISFIFMFITIIANSLMFLHIYGISGCKFDIEAGIDLVVNIVFLLFAFLCAANCKKYDKNAAIISVVLGVIEIIRIFIIPLKYLKIHAKDATLGLTVGNFTYVVILLIVAAVFSVAAGIITYYKANKLANYLKENPEERA